jgi:multiple sugar transport system substrate-binding protein
MINARSTLVWLAVAALPVAVAACGGGQGPTQVQWYINPDDGGQAEIARRCTESAHGRYQVSTSPLPRNASDQREQLLRRLAAKDSSIDLMSLDPVFVAEFAQAGFLAPIPQDQAHAFTAGVLKPAVTGASWRGRLVAAPFWANTQVLWYRKSVASKARLDLRRPVTWGQIIGAARATHKTVAVQAKRYEGYTVLINALIASAGGNILWNPGADVDHLKLGIASPAGQKAVAIISSIAHSGVGGPEMSTEDEEAARTLFQGPTGGFMVNWPYVWRAASSAVEDGSLQRSVLDDIAWARYPQAIAGKPSRPPLGGIDLAVGNWSKHRDFALDAARCITSEENETYYFLSNGNPAARADVFSRPEVIKAFPMAPLLRDSLEASAPRPQTQYYGDLSAGLQRSWHPPEGVTPNTPRASQSFILDVLDGKRLL